MEGCQLIGSDWRYLYLNDAAEGHNRRPNAELLGRTMLEAWPGIEASAGFAMLRRCMDERLVQDGEWEFLFPDGTTRWFDVRSQPVPEGILVLSTDITERRQAEKKVRESEGRYRSLFENAPDGISVAHAGKDFVEVNSNLCRMLGYTRDELIGQSTSMIVPERELPRYGEWVGFLKDNAAYRQERWLRRKRRFRNCQWK